MRFSKDENGKYIISGSNEISKWSNGRQSLSSKRNPTKELAQKHFYLLIMRCLNATHLIIEPLKNEVEKVIWHLMLMPTFYGFLASSEMGEKLVLSTTVPYDQDISIQFENISEPRF